MRTLKYAILGLLNRKSMTGYDIARAFEQGLGNFWSAGHSQIYPELKKLTDEGLIEFDTVIQGEKMEKKLYTLTRAGKDEFIIWAMLDEPPEPTQKDVFKLRVYLSDSMDDSQLASHFRSQLAGRAKRLEMLERIMDENYGAAEYSSMDKISRGDYLVLQSAILRERAYVNWLNWGLSIIGKDAD